MVEGFRLAAHALQTGRWPAFAFHTEAFAHTERGERLVRDLVGREGPATWPAIEGLIKGKRCVLADAAGELTPWEFDWKPPVALIVSSEAHGASAEARGMAQSSVRLPMAEEAESLNAAIAAAVLLYEAQHQRKWRCKALPTD